jgi:YYY domain-containing protein
VVLDWLSREGWIIFNWWLLVTIAGATVLPLLTRLLSGLPDRGYTLARPAGMLLIGVVFWFMAILGFIDNSSGSVVLAWLIVLTLSLTVHFKLPGASFSWRDWWRENRTAVIVSELLFIALMLIWALYRAHQNELRSTEKPMDLAFMSAIRHSATFPPSDPWLSGYSISYYYFGYVLAATMSMLTGVATTIGFNMNIALLFALIGTTTFGVVYNLVRSRAYVLKEGIRILPYAAQPARVAIVTGLLAMVFIIWMGNFFLPLVEIPYQTGNASESYLEFWDVDGRDEALPESQGRNSIEQWDGWWWFKASRAIEDQDLNGNHIEVIAEFPQFSFLLADSHPHVMALSFGLLAMGLALNTLLMPVKPQAPHILLYGVCIGALIFLNTWDFPVYLALLVGADALRRMIKQRRLLADDFLQLFVLGIFLLIISVVVYFPFIVGFSSQLKGILPNIINPTKFPQLFLMFGPFMLILGSFLVLESWRGARERRMNWSLGLLVTLGIAMTLVAIMILLAILGTLIPSIKNWALNYIEANGGWGTVLPEVFARRFMAILTPLTLMGALMLVVGRLFPKYWRDDNEEPYPAATGFALLAIGAGVLLVLAPEFVYLRDHFNTRMNTVFKFYYQAWALFSVAGAYAVYTFLGEVELKRPALPFRALFGVMTTLILAAGLMYPVLGMYYRMFVETGRSTTNDTPLTMDGGPGFIGLDDYNAIICLGDLVGRDDVVVAEANPQGRYVNYNANHGRVGSLTGIPVLIGWPNHESQWRGDGYPAAVGTRRYDLDMLYTDLRIDVVRRVLDQYEVDYIMYGAIERQYYSSAGEEKFIDNFELVCESGESRIYRVK